MADACLEFPYGALRHIPAGSYYQQVATWQGKVELELMSVFHTAWFTFKYLKMSEWKEAQTGFMDWLRKPPPPEPQTRRVDTIIAITWRISVWTLQILETIRRNA